MPINVDQIAISIAMAIIQTLPLKDIFSPNKKSRISDLLLNECLFLPGQAPAFPAFHRQRKLIRWLFHRHIREIN